MKAEQELSELAGRLSNQRSIGGACGDALEFAMALTGASCAEVMFRDTRTRQLICLANRGDHPWCAAQSGGRRLASKLAEMTLPDQRLLCVGDVGADPRLAFRLPAGAELAQAMSVPLVVRGRTLGAVNLCGTADAKLCGDLEEPLAVMGAMLAPIIENIYVSERATAEDSERRQFLVRELEASEDERRRMARELHDGLGQTLTGLVMSIDSAIALLSRPGSGDEAVEALRRARETAAIALHDVRRVILALRPPALDDMGLFAAIETYARRILRDAGIEVLVRSSGRPEGLSPVVESVVFRVAQEAINNVARHSRASTCRLTLKATESVVRTRVEDDGDGFDAAAPIDSGRHVGLASMKERMELIGGRLLISSQPGHGSKVDVRVSYRGTSNDANTNRDR